MRKIILFAISALILAACNNEPKQPTQQSSIHEEEHHDDHPETLQLNHGEKWMVNNEMKPFVLEGESLVDNYLKNNETNYKQLANQLKAQNSMLVKSCTMDGASHEELHKWLHPHLELVKALESETNEIKSAETVLQIQQSYQLYHQYFN